MSPFVISPEDMENLTGVKNGKKQCEVLRKNGIRYTERNDGSPALSWEAYNRQVACGTAEIVSLNAGPRLEAV